MVWRWRERQSLDASSTPATSEAPGASATPEPADGPVTFPDGTTATYRYDGLGRRYEKTFGNQTTRYVYAGWTGAVAEGVTTLEEVLRATPAWE